MSMSELHWWWCICLASFCWHICHRTYMKTKSFFVLPQWPQQTVQCCRKAQFWGCKFIYIYHALSEKAAAPLWGQFITICRFHSALRHPDLHKKHIHRSQFMPAFAIFHFFLKCVWVCVCVCKYFTQHFIKKRLLWSEAPAAPSPPGDLKWNGRWCD